jgi:uncharacterized protein
LRWTWHDDKNRTNQRDHGLSFETAQLVFRDPLAASRRDPDTGEEVGRIISARKATSHERRAYEEGEF